MGTAAQSSPDIDALVTAIHGGVFEEPYWTGFLADLRKITASDYASLSFRRADARSKDVTVIKSGDAIDDAAADSNVSEIVRRLRLPYDSIEINRPYSLQEMVDLNDTGNQEYIDYLKARHFADTCVLRVEEPAGGTVWLTIGQSGGLYPPAVARLLARIAPHLGIAAHTLARLESERMHAEIARDAVHKLNFGWLTFDARARVIEIDPGAETLFRKTPSLARCKPGEVFPMRRAANWDLVELLAAAAEKRTLHARAVHLVDEPWLDMLIVPIRYRAVSGGVTPVAVGYVHGVGVANADRCEQLIQLFGLTASEARLALVLSQGRSIAQAAAELGFTIETARNYSKRIYAKTDTRGQADLVRIILASVIALS